MKIKPEQLKQLVEAAIFVANEPIDEQRLLVTVLSEFSVSKEALKKCLDELTADYATRGVQLVKVASGYRFQSADSLSQHLSRLWLEHTPKYSRALLETLALIAYRQPVTRGQIEEVRGVAVSSHIIKTLTDRQWIKVVGHKDVPGKPALYATTKAFLDYFSLGAITDLPRVDLFDQLTNQPFPDSNANQDQETDQVAQDGSTEDTSAMVNDTAEATSARSEQPSDTTRIH